VEIGMVCRGHCFGNGLIMRAVGDRMIIAPPLVITRAQIDEMVSLIRRCLDLTLADARKAGSMDSSNSLIDSPDGPEQACCLDSRLHRPCPKPTARLEVASCPPSPSCSPSAWPWPFP
jgi:hypothetical protein